MNITVDKKIDMENQIISFSCASPAPFPRELDDHEVYDEVLVINEESVNLDRLNGGASVLKNHDDNCIVGVVKKAWIQDNKLCVTAQFRKNDSESKKLFLDIVEGTVKNVSVGYIQNEIKFEKQNNKMIGYVTKWTPYEVSVAVGVPADSSVGFYRSMTEKKEGKSMNQNCKKSDEEILDEETKETGVASSDKEKIDELEARLAELENKLKAVEEEQKEVSEQEEVQEEQEADTKEESSDVPEEALDDASSNKEEEEIRALAEEFKCEHLVKDALERKLSVNDFKTEIKRNLNKKGNVKIMEKYNVCRAFQALLNQNVNASIERSMSDELYRQAGRTPRNDAFMLRDFTGASGVGDGLIGTDHRADMFTEILRTKLGVKGATILGGLVGNVDIPAQTTAVEAEVTSVNGTLTGQEPKVGSILLTPKKFGAIVKIGKDLIAQGNPDAIGFVINDISAQIARALDLAILKGDDTNAIDGIAGTTGVQTVTIADVSTATWKDFLKFGGLVEGYDLTNDPSFVMSATDKATLKGISKDAGSGRYIIENNELDGYAVNVCGKLATGEIFFGDWSNIIIGNWGGLEIVVDPYTEAASGSVRVIATLLADVGVRNPQGFVKAVNA